MTAEGDSPPAAERGAIWAAQGDPGGVTAYRHALYSLCRTLGCHGWAWVGMDEPQRSGAM